jgi:hypothetical protein
MDWTVMMGAETRLDNSTDPLEKSGVSGFETETDEREGLRVLSGEPGDGASSATMLIKTVAC